MTKKALDSKPAECIMRRGLGERARKDTPRYMLPFYLDRHLANAVCCYTPEQKEHNHHKLNNLLMRKVLEMRKATLLRHPRPRRVWRALAGLAHRVSLPRLSILSIPPRGRQRPGGGLSISPLIRLATRMAAISHQFCVCGSLEVGAAPSCGALVKYPRNALEIQYHRSVTIQAFLRGVANFPSFEVTFVGSGHSSSTYDPRLYEVVTSRSPQEALGRQRS